MHLILHTNVIMRIEIVQRDFSNTSINSKGRISKLNVFGAIKLKSQRCDSVKSKEICVKVKFLLPQLKMRHLRRPLKEIDELVQDCSKDIKICHFLQLKFM